MAIILKKLNHIKMAQDKLMKLISIAQEKIETSENGEISVHNQNNSNYLLRQNSKDYATITVIKSGNKIIGYMIKHDSYGTSKIACPHQYTINVDHNFKITSESWHTLIFGPFTEFSFSLSINYRLSKNELHFSVDQYNDEKIDKIKNNYFSTDRLDLLLLKDFQKKIFLSYVSFKNPKLVEEVFNTDDFEKALKHELFDENIDVLRMYQF
jgi:hypothetical protein